MSLRMRSLLKIVFLMILVIMTVPIRNGLCQETYPNRPITMIVNYGAGTIDTLTRVICKVAEKELGQPIIVENKPGATGTIGINYVLKAKPDGYTLGTSSTTEYIHTPHMQKSSFNVLTDLTDILAFFKYSWGLCVRADAPWNTFEEVISYAKKNPGKFTYASPGVASTMHITMERIAMKEGITWTGIPFKGGGEAVLACLGGNVDAVPQTALVVAGHLQAGKLKMLLILSDSRWPDFPTVPHIMEKGYDFCAFSYGSVYGPVGLQEPVKQKLETVFKKAMADPLFLEQVKRFHMEVPTFKSGKEYSDFWKSKYDEMGKVIKALGL